MLVHSIVFEVVLLIQLQNATCLSILSNSYSFATRGLQHKYRALYLSSIYTNMQTIVYMCRLKKFMEFPQKVAKTRCNGKRNIETEEPVSK